MGIAIDRLTELLLSMAGENAPGREFAAAIAELARTGRFPDLQLVLPPVVYDELWQRYRLDAEGFVEEWEQLAWQMQQGFVQHARQRLTSLTRLQQADSRVTPPWELIQRALDSRQNDLLRAAMAAEFLDLIEPAVARATHLRECVIGSETSEEADRYLDEATRCYFLGLFTACAVMCPKPCAGRSGPDTATPQPWGICSTRSTTTSPRPELRPAFRNSPIVSTTLARKLYIRACSQKTRPAVACRTPARRFRCFWSVERPLAALPAILSRARQHRPPELQPSSPNFLP